jgi:hypothetical protein
MASVTTTALRMQASCTLYATLRSRGWRVLRWLAEQRSGFLASSNSRLILGNAFAQHFSSPLYISFFLLSWREREKEIEKTSGSPQHFCLDTLFSLSFCDFVFEKFIKMPVIIFSFR